MPRPYNKKQFVEIFCESCGLCDKKKDPSFCYVELYRHSPKEFVDAVWRNLSDVDKVYKSSGRSPTTMSVEQFQNIFCVTGLCDNGNMDICMLCDRLDDCYELFRAQLGALPLKGVKITQDTGTIIAPAVTGKTKTKRYTAYQKKKRRKRVVYTSYPTFYSRQDTEFQEFIKRTLYGNNNNEQNPGEEPAGEDTTAVSGASEG